MRWKAEEHLAISCHPYLGIKDGIPVGGEQVVQTVYGSRKSDAADYQDNSQHQQQRQRNLACDIDTFVDTLYMTIAVKTQIMINGTRRFI